MCTGLSLYFYYASFAWNAQFLRIFLGIYLIILLVGRSRLCVKLVFVLVLQYVPLKFEIVRAIRMSLLNLLRVTTHVFINPVKIHIKIG